MVAAHRQIRGRNIEVDGNRRPLAAGVEGEALDHVLGKHRVLQARHVRGGKTLAGNAVQVRTGRETEGGSGDVDADAQLTVGDPRHRERVVDLGRADVIQADGLHLGERKVLGRRRDCVRGKTGAPGKEFEEEAVQMEIVAVREQAAAFEQPCRRKAGLLARLLERFSFGLGTIRGVQQLLAQRRDLGGTFEAHEARGPLGDPFLQAPLLLQAGERQLEGFRRRGLKAAPPAAIEVHRRRVQFEKYSRRFNCRGLAADVLARKVAEIELVGAAALP